MASMPPQQPSQRRSSPEQASSAAQADQTATASDAPDSTTSDGSPIAVFSPHSTAIPTSQDRPTILPPRRQDTDLKKCWICFADETEDTPETSKWRSPCPCALVAHEECLLDWIADMESPSSRKRSIAPPKILCPQCKSEIHLARPWNPLVEAVKAFQRASARYTTPSILVVASSSIAQAFTVHGIHSIFTVFGTHDAMRILEPVLYPHRHHDLWDVRGILLDFKEHWRLNFGLKLITPMLVLSRTTLADSILPVLPILFFATQGDPDQPVDFIKWPPSASMAVSVLPYIRSVYNAYYTRVWAHHEKRWLKEIQPRTEQNNQQEGDNQAANPEGQAEEQVANEEGVFEIRVDGDLWNNWDGGGNDGGEERNADQRNEEAAARIAERLNAANAQGNQEIQQDEAHPLNAPPLADADAGPDVRLQEPLEHVDIPRHPPAPPEPQAQQPAAAPQNGDRRLSLSTNGLAEKVLGALLFPSIAAMSGELLRLVLPASWASPASWTLAPGGGYHTRARDTGILQRRWGRSIVGGCLFVVVKDAVMLYVRWKMAQQHRRRRVLDYDRKKKRVVNG